MRRWSWLAATLLAIGCGTSSVDVATTEEPKATLAKFNVDGAPTVAFEVPEMHCESCVAHVEGILGEQPGVKDVEVDLESKVAKVAVDEKEFDAEKAVAALVDVRFFEAKLITAGKATGDAAKPGEEAQEAAPAESNPVDEKSEAAKS
jgi:copper chaperone CopZ